MDTQSPRRVRHVLACKGGGIRGIFQARVLQDIEERTGTPIVKFFDLIAGTSAGAINTCALAAGLRPQEIINLYRGEGRLIFNHGGHGFGAFAAKHSATGIENVLQHHFGKDATFTSSDTKLIACAWNYTCNKPKTLKSWDPEPWIMWHVARASSAAPTYFPPFVLQDNAYIDGGVAANDPSLWALAEARRLWPEDEIRLVTVGTGYRARRNRMPIGGGVLPWMPHIIEVLMDGNQTNVPYQCAALADHHVHIDDALPEYVNPAMDDASPGNVAALLQFAEEVTSTWTGDL